MTSDIPTLRDLQARVEAAEGPDRELDQDLYCAVGGCSTDKDGMRDAYRAPSYTASLDAAIALIERVLPGWSYMLAHNGRDGIANVHIAPIGASQRWASAGQARTAALALCAALLKALIAQARQEAIADMVRTSQELGLD